MNLPEIPAKLFKADGVTSTVETNAAAAAYAQTLNALPSMVINVMREAAKTEIALMANVMDFTERGTEGHAAANERHHTLQFLLVAFHLAQISRIA